MIKSKSSALTSNKKIDQSKSIFNIKTRFLSRQSIRSISDEFEIIDIVEKTNNDIIVSSKKNKKAKTRNVFVREIDIGENANYQKMTKKDSSKITKTIKIENQKKLKKILLRKNDVT